MYKVITSPRMTKARTQAYRLTHEQYLNIVSASVLPGGAAAAAFDNLVRFHRDRPPHPARGRTGGGGRVLHRTADDIQSVMIEVAPVVGTARVAPAGGKIPRALDFAAAVADSEMADEAGAGQ